MSTFYNPEREIEERSKGEGRAAWLEKNGGKCQVGEDGFLTIKLKDGRVFEACGLHGFGGIISKKVSLPFVQNIIRTKKKDDFKIRLYLVLAWWGDCSLYVDADEIEDIQVVA